VEKLEKLSNILKESYYLNVSMLEFLYAVAEPEILEPRQKIYRKTLLPTCE